MSYWKLVHTRAFKDTRNFWNAHQIWKYTGPPVSAIILRLLIRRWSPMGSWEAWVIQGIVFILFGFIVTWGRTYLLNLVRVPATLHREQVQVIDQLAKDKSVLQAQVDDLKKPTRTAFEEENYQETRAILERYRDGGDEKIVLRHLIRFSKMQEHHSAGLSPVPPGFSRERALSTLIKMEADQIVTHDYQSVPGGWARTWHIAPGVESFLKELL